MEAPHYSTIDRIVHPILCGVLQLLKTNNGGCGSIVIILQSDELISKINELMVDANMTTNSKNVKQWEHPQFVLMVFIIPLAQLNRFEMEQNTDILMVDIRNVSTEIVTSIIQQSSNVVQVFLFR